MDDSTSKLETEAPAFDDIVAAAARLKGVVPRHHLLESERLNARLGGRLLVKAETLNPTGSFKVRGAWNTITQLGTDKLTGLLALSSGNHGQAVAWAARRAGISRTVVYMPNDAPKRKIEDTRQWGADVRFFDRKVDDRDALIATAVAREGLQFIPAFDHKHIIAGAGTLALEIVDDLDGLGGLQANHLVAACSGGGLVAGCALALDRLSSATDIWGVEPVGFDDTAQSLRQGHRVHLSSVTSSICDAILAPTPGALTFGINKRHLSGILTGSDDQALLGMRTAFEEFGLVAEPGGALALGVLLSAREMTAGKSTVVVLSGRNTDPGIFARSILNP